MELHYTSPASYWEEALPLGNGRLGAMVWSGTGEERLSLNEDSLWSGYPQCHDVEGAAEHYPEARRLALAGQYREAQAYIEDHLLGKYTQSYLPLGDLALRMDHSGENTENYRRSLALDRAVSRLQYTADGVTHTREAFVSHPDQVIVLRLTADRAGAISFRAGLHCQLRSGVRAGGNRLVLEGIAPSQVDPSYVDSSNPVIYKEQPEKKGMRFAAVLSVEPEGGTLRADGQELCVESADSVMLRLCARTSFNGPFRQPFTDGLDEQALCEADLAKAEARTYAQLLSRHEADYRPYFDRVTLNLGQGKTDLPIPERLAGWDKEGDPALYALLFQYGRYLTIAASRPGTQPTNLQGIWNRHIRAPWSSNFTININTEMNYWACEAAGLPEFHRPLFDLINTLRVTGAKTAQTHYGARGFVSHHNSDIWGLSNSVGDSGRGTATYAFWPMSAGWLSSHAFEHYRFSQEKAFLRDTAYHILRDAARFYLDVLTEDADKTLIFAPSTSPENMFLTEGGASGVSKTATMTTAIIRETLRNTVQCCKILGIDHALQAEAEDALGRLPGYKTGSRGELLEWSEELPEAEPLHRHTSHLYPLHPGHDITMDGTPELAAACRKTLELRGDESTGWALAWRINLWARLGDAEKAYAVLQKQLRPVRGDTEMTMASGGGCYPNLFGAHPPFQIDSNFGVCAGIAELLLQSTETEITLLPALPKAFADGCVTGLRARGGVTADIHFEKGALVRAELRLNAGADHTITVAYSGKRLSVPVRASESTRLSFSDFR